MAIFKNAYFYLEPHTHTMSPKPKKRKPAHAAKPNPNPQKQEPRLPKTNPQTEAQPQGPSDKRPPKKIVAGVVAAITFIILLATTAYDYFIKDENHKERVGAAYEFFNSMKHDTFFCKVIMTEPSSYTHNGRWLPNGFNCYEAHTVVGDFYSITAGFNDPKLTNTFLQPDSNLVRFDPRNINSIDTVEKNGKKEILLSVNPLNAPSDETLSFGGMAMAAPDFYSQAFLGYVSHPYLPQEIKEPLTELSKIKYRQISLQRLIENEKKEITPDAVSAIVLFSRSKAGLDSLKPTTLLYEPYNSSTNTSYFFGEIEYYSSLVCSRTAHFLEKEKK